MTWKMGESTVTRGLSSFTKEDLLNFFEIPGHPSFNENVNGFSVLYAEKNFNNYAIESILTDGPDYTQDYDGYALF